MDGVISPSSPDFQSDSDDETELSCRGPTRRSPNRPLPGRRWATTIGEPAAVTSTGVGVEQDDKR
jgi:hypothetical protein